MFAAQTNKQPYTMETTTYVFAGKELTLREMQIIALMVQKDTRKMIAAKLNTNSNTLGHQITILFIKTECPSNIDLIFKALDNGFDRQGNYNGKPLL
jgi:DNA-binding CsgD family transcriptional regulator